MWPPDGVAPIPHVGPDTLDRWLVRDVPLSQIEPFLNAAASLGWEFQDAATVTEAEPPLVEEVLRVWCSAKVPKPKRKRAATKAPVEAEG